MLAQSTAYFQAYQCFKFAVCWRQFNWNMLHKAMLLPKCANTKLQTVNHWIIRKSSLEVTPTTLTILDFWPPRYAFTVSNSGLFCTMVGRLRPHWALHCFSQFHFHFYMNVLFCDLEFDRVKVNNHAKYLGPRSVHFILNSAVTYAHNTTQWLLSTWPLKTNVKYSVMMQNDVLQLQTVHQFDWSIHNSYHSFSIMRIPHWTNLTSNRYLIYLHGTAKIWSTKYEKSKLIHPPIVDDVTIRMLEYLIHNNNLRN